jgi:hypothetical protein
MVPKIMVRLRRNRGISPQRHGNGYNAAARFRHPTMKCVPAEQKLARIFLFLARQL